MANVDRRRFLQMAAAAAVPLPFEQALSIAAHDRHGSDVWPADGGVDLSVHGPNGFYRRFAAGARPSGVVTRARYDARRQGLTLELANRGTDRAELAIADRYTGRHSRVVLRPGETRTEDFGLTKSHGWYGVTLTVPADPHFAVEYAGHVENGEPSVSDPLMGGVTPAAG